MAKTTLTKAKFTKPERGEVAFSKVKFLKEGGVEAEFSRQNGDEVVECTEKAASKRHPDLDNLLSELKPFLAMNYQITTAMAKMKKLAMERAFDFVPAKEQAAFKELLEQDDTETRKAIYQSMEITGISVSGADNFEGGKISGKITDLYGGFSAMNSARIIFSSEKLGFEAEVQRIFDAIHDEVYEYLYNGKRAQPELFSKQPGTDKGEEE